MDTLDESKNKRNKKSLNPAENKSYYRPGSKNIDQLEDGGNKTKGDSSFSDIDGGESGGLGYYRPNGKGQRENKIRGALTSAFRGKRKFGWIAGGLITLILGGAFTFLPLLGPLHIFNNLSDFHLEPNRFFRAKRTRTLVKKIRNYRTPDEIPSTIKDADSVTKQLARLRTNDLQDFLRIKGMRLDLDADGNPLAIIDNTGRRVSMDSDDAFRLLDEAASASKAMRRGYIKQFFRQKFNYSWKPILKLTAPDESIWKTIYSRTALRAADNPLPDEINEPDENGQPKPVDDTDIKSGVDGIETGVDETRSRLADGVDPPEAIKSGAEKASSSTNVKSIVVGAIVASCVVKAIYDNELQIKYANAMAAVQQVLDLAVITSELQHGDAQSAKHIGQYMKQFANDSGSFAASAGWQQITGQEVTGPGLNPENDINKTTADGVLGSILGSLSEAGAVVDKLPGLSEFCKVFNAFAGTIIGSAILNIVDLIGLAVSCGTVVACGLNIFATVAIPRLFTALLSATATKLLSDPAQAFNFLAHSAAFVNSETSRTGKPVSNAEYAADVVAVYQDYQKENNKRSFYARYLDQDNKFSLIYRLSLVKTNLVYSDKSPTKMLASVLRAPFVSLSKTALAMSGNSMALAYAGTPETDPAWSITKYSLNNALDVDAAQNASEVRKMMGYDESTNTYTDDPSDLQKDVRDTAKYCMGYDYLTDSLNPDLQLPRYSNPGDDGDGFFSSLTSIFSSTPDAGEKNSLVEKYCGYNDGDKMVEPKIGVDDYAKLGRFVDDLLLLKSLGELIGEHPLPADGTGGTIQTSPPPAPSAPEPEPTPPPECDPNSTIGGVCIN